MTGERLHGMLKMLADATGGGSSAGSAAGGSAGDGVFCYDMTLPQLRAHLGLLIDKELIEYIDGSYQLVLVNDGK